jgi:hypothetical protein
MKIQTKQWYIDNSSNADEAVGKYIGHGGADAIFISSLRGYTGRWGSSLSRGGGTPPTTTSKMSITNIDDINKSSKGISQIYESQNKIDPNLYSTNSVDRNKTLQDEILKQLARESQFHTDINEKMGITGELSRAYRDSMLETEPAARRLGFDLQAITNMMTTLSDSSMRFNLISQDTMTKSFETARAFGMTLSQLAEAMGKYEEVGVGAGDALLKINTAARSSLSLGLNSKRTTEELTKSLGKLNEYGFANGVQGLNRMVQKSAEFRMNMQNVFTIADKVMSPDAAIELTANLQVLGGAIGDFNDPLKLMYMATNNVEGLQDSLIGAASGLATYNDQQKRFEVTGVNLRRAKEMANQLGISVGDLNKTAVAAQERLLANTELLARGFKIESKDKEFITNMAQMKDGKMSIVIPPTLVGKLGSEIGNQSEIAIDKLTQDQINALEKYRKEIEEANPADLARAQFSATKNIELATDATAQFFVKDFKNKIFGRTDYTGDKTDKQGTFQYNKLRQDELKLRETGYEMTTGGEGGRTKLGQIMNGMWSGLNALTSTLQILIRKETEIVDDLFNNVKSGNLQKKEEEKKKYDDLSNPKNNQLTAKVEVRMIGTGYSNENEPRFKVIGTPYTVLT